MTDTMRRSKVEHIKENSHNLRGRLREELQQPETTHFAEESVQLLKFHGIYQQDDRDGRKARKDAGLEPDYAFMVRTKIRAATPRQPLPGDGPLGRCPR